MAVFCLNLFRRCGDNSDSVVVQTMNNAAITRACQFSMIWAIGGILEEPDRAKFERFAKGLWSSMTHSLPKTNIFQHFIDETGEWKDWNALIGPKNAKAVREHGRIVVPTVRSTQMDYLMQSCVDLSKVMI